MCTLARNNAVTRMFQVQHGDPEASRVIFGQPRPTWNLRSNVFSTSRIMPKLVRLSVLSLATGAFVGGLTVLGGVTPASASTNFYLSSYGSDAGGNPCTSSSSPCLTLQHAYNEASSSGTTTINLAAGTYQGDFGVPFVPGQKLIEKNLDLVGSTNGGSLNAVTTTISGGGEETAIINEGKTMQLSNLVIDDTTGEAIANNGTMTLTNVTVGPTTGSGAVPGAGIANSGPLTMTGGSISGNSAFFPGGGLYNDEGSTAILKNVTITHNTSEEDGGGIFNFQDSTVHLEGTTSLHNNSATDGGGIENCASDGSVITFGPDVVNTGNAPNDLNTNGPDC
jgi:hypothetical protein